MAQQELEHNFHLSERIEKDSSFVIDLPLTQVRLIHNALYPWLLLIPRRANITEIHQMQKEDRDQLWNEVQQVSVLLEELTNADKMNVGALGNVVPQLHFHIIARSKKDPAWPGPVWGHPDFKAYETSAKEQLISKILTKLSNL